MATNNVSKSRLSQGVLKCASTLLVCVLIGMLVPLYGDFCNEGNCRPGYPGKRLTYQCKSSGGTFACCTDPPGCMYNASGYCYTNSSCGAGSWACSYYDCDQVLHDLDNCCAK